MHTAQVFMLKGSRHAFETKTAYKSRQGKSKVAVQIHDPPVAPTAAESQYGCSTVVLYCCSYASTIVRQ